MRILQPAQYSLFKGVRAKRARKKRVFACQRLSQYHLDNSYGKVSLDFQSILVLMISARPSAICLLILFLLFLFLSFDTQYNGR
jgi:hypothetical protein